MLRVTRSALHNAYTSCGKNCFVNTKLTVVGRSFLCQFIVRSACRYLKYTT